MQSLFDAVREASSTRSWSLGVELARAESVSADDENGGEIQLRVATRGGMISPTVMLYLEDDDWECSCASTEDACEHVVAAIIALRRARKNGQALPEPEASPGRLRYCFERHQGGLGLEREIVQGDQRHPLRSTLDALASGRVAGPPFAADQRDLRAEVTLGSTLSGPLSRELMAKLVDCLAGSEQVLLDRQPVEISSERVVPHGLLEDSADGFRLSVTPDPSITEQFDNGAVLCGDTLRVVGDNKLTGRELQDLPTGRFYSHEQAALLATEVLPSLSERIPVEIKSTKLPQTTETATPRILLKVEREADRLCVFPSLVYGEPPSARIDAGELKHLGGPIPVRDLAAERRERAQLQSELGLAPGHRIMFDGEEALKMAARLSAWRGEISGDAHRSFYRAPELEARIQIADAGFELHFESTLSEQDSSKSDNVRRVSAQSVLNAWQTGASAVSLTDGGLAALPSDWLQRFGHRVADLLAARDESGELPTCALPALAQLCDELEQPRPAALDGLLPLLEDFEGIPPASLPADLRAELRDYQRRGVDWLCFLRDAGLGALLADDMGLGKTLQALCALGQRSLVVAPTSVLHNWASEIERFRPGMRCQLYHGPKRSLEGDADVILTSYAILRLDAAVLSKVEWDAIVLDEAQYIKNSESQVAQAAYRLRGNFRMALTGTPVENRLDELWSQFHFLNRGLLGGLSDFRQRCARPMSEGDASAAQRLRDRIRPFVLRRLKREVAPELPPRSEVVLHLELAPSEREVYDAVRAATVKRAVARLKAGGGVMEALEALLRLRQAACHSGLVPGQSADSSSKVETLVERLEQAVADQHKALVFSQWTSLLDRIEPHLRDSQLDFLRLDGATRQRREVVERFQQDSGPPILLVSLKAGGTGLNLTAADHIFLMDPWWNPAVEDQAADRAHRIGQTRPVVIHRLVARNTVEEGILRLHESKRALSEMALEEAGQKGGLTRDDLLGLLEAP